MAGNLKNEKMKNEKWKMKNEKWKMKNEKWKMKNEKWKIKNEKLKMKILRLMERLYVYDQQSFAPYQKESIPSLFCSDILSIWY